MSDTKWKQELLDWVSACQSAYYIESTPGHRFGGIPGALAENREAIVDFVQSLLDEKEARVKELVEALLKCGQAIEQTVSEMTVGDRFTNAGQALLDVLPVTREALTTTTWKELK